MKFTLFSGAMEEIVNKIGKDVSATLRGKILFSSLEFKQKILRF